MAATDDSDVALVEAPTGLAGFQLLMRFPELRSQNKQDAQGRWTVRVWLSDSVDVRTLIERVQVWMRQERIAETSASIGADVYRVRVDRSDLETPKAANELETGV